MIDLNYIRNMEILVMNYESMTPNIQESINQCFLSMDNILKKCNKNFEEGCFLATNYVVSKNCPQNYIPIGYGYCVPICP